MTTAATEREKLRVAMGRTRIETIPRDPHTAWVYWELTAAGVRKALGQLDYLPRLEIQVRGRPADSEPLVATSYVVTHWLAGQFVEGLHPGVPFDVVIGGWVDEEFIPIVSTSLKRAPRSSAGSRAPTFVSLVEDPRMGPPELELTDYDVSEAELFTRAESEAFEG